MKKLLTALGAAAVIATMTMPVSAEKLYAKGLNVSHVHTSDKALVGEVFSILNNMEFLPK